MAINVISAMIINALSVMHRIFWISPIPVYRAQHATFTNVQTAKMGLNALNAKMDTI